MREGLLWALFRTGLTHYSSLAENQRWACRWAHLFENKAPEWKLAEKERERGRVQEEDRYEAIVTTHICKCMYSRSLGGKSTLVLESIQWFLIPVGITTWTTPNPTWPTAIFYTTINHTVHAEVQRRISSISNSVIGSCVFPLWVGANRLYKTLWCYE